MKEELVHRPLSETKGAHLQFNFGALGDLESIFQQNWRFFRVSINTSMMHFGFEFNTLNW